MVLLSDPCLTLSILPRSVLTLRSTESAERLLYREFFDSERLRSRPTADGLPGLRMADGGLPSCGLRGGDRVRDMPLGLPTFLVKDVGLPTFRFIGGGLLGGEYDRPMSLTKGGGLRGGRSLDAIAGLPRLGLPIPDSAVLGGVVLRTIASRGRTAGLRGGDFVLTSLDGAVGLPEASRFRLPDAGLLGGIRTTASRARAGGLRGGDCVHTSLETIAGLLGVMRERRSLEEAVGLFARSRAALVTAAGLFGGLRALFEGLLGGVWALRSPTKLVPHLAGGV